MNKTLEDLFDDYIKNPSLETQDPISSYYEKNSKDRKEIEEKIKNFLRQDLPEGGISWEIFFESNMKFWKEVYLIDQEHVAKKNYERTLKNNDSSSFFLESSVDMCEIACNNTIEIKGLKERIEEVWINTFKEFPQFKEMLEAERVAKKERLKKHLESLNLSPQQVDSYLNETPLESNKETIKTLEIIVPILPEVNGKKISNFEEIKNTEEYQEFIKNRIEYFNNFQLEGYIEMPECHSIKMRVEGDNNIFTLSLNNSLDENKLKEELLGQLSDGLGENLSQKGILIEDKKYYFDFDIKNSSELYEINKNKKPKIK